DGPDAANATPLTTMGVSGAAMFCDIQAGWTENLPSWCTSLTPRIAPLGTGPSPPTPRPGTGPATGMSSQRAPAGAVGAGDDAGAAAAAEGTGAGSCHIAGACGGNGWS